MVIEGVETRRMGDCSDSRCLKLILEMEWCVCVCGRGDWYREEDRARCWVIHSDARMSGREEDTKAFIERGHGREFSWQGQTGNEDIAEWTGTCKNHLLVRFLRGTLSYSGTRAGEAREKSVSQKENVLAFLMTDIKLWPHVFWGETQWPS